MPGWDEAKLAFMRSGGYNVAAQIPTVGRHRARPWRGPCSLSSFQGNSPSLLSLRETPLPCVC